MPLVAHLECRRILRANLSAVVDPRGGDVGMAQPFLNLGDVRLVLERVGGRRGAERVVAEAGDVDARLRSPVFAHLVDAA